MKIIYPKTKSNELTYKELKDLIKSLANTGRIAEAQDIIFQALNKQVDLNAIKSLDILVRHKHFMASKLSPRTFGSDKQQVTLQNNRGEKIQIEWSK